VSGEHHKTRQRLRTQSSSSVEHLRMRGFRTGEWAALPTYVVPYATRLATNMAAFFAFWTAFYALFGALGETVNFGLYVLAYYCLRSVLRGVRDTTSVRTQHLLLHTLQFCLWLQTWHTFFFLKRRVAIAGWVLECALACPQSLLTVQVRCFDHPWAFHAAGWSWRRVLGNCVNSLYCCG
jgi:hypothetical protein